VLAVVVDGSLRPQVARPCSKGEILADCAGAGLMRRRADILPDPALVGLVAAVRFDATLSTIGTSTVLRLPETAVHGTVNGVGFQAVLEPDGKSGHWMRWIAPGILEALIPGRMQSHASTAEVP
jgi:hypothetical protein